jgi:hypothetical protein
MSYYRTLAKRNWLFWRPIVERVLSYSEACEMDIDELYEVNAALDIYIEQKNKANKKGGKK